MFDDFLKYTSEEKLVVQGQKTLLSVSGGIDSMVMAHLFIRAGFDIAILHCNFTLRGDDSFTDEDFVRDFAASHHFDFFAKRFSTAVFARKTRVSVQMAARELRTTWSEEVVASEGFSCYATAHHLDDQIETFFINLLRSTGLSGLHGILPRQGNCIHPLLFAWRKDIETYATENQIPFREDASNARTTYLRNKIRKWLIPTIEQIDPGAKTIINENIRRIRKSELVYMEEITRQKQRLVKAEDEMVRINLAQLLVLENREIILFEILREYGFSFHQAEDILSVHRTSSGKKFFSPTHRLIINRNELLIIQTEADKIKNENRYLIEEGCCSIDEPVHMRFEVIANDSGYAVSKNPNIADVDFSKLTFPLEIRKWQQGDRFIPLGMRKRKKVSDFFIDNKMSQFQKNAAWLMVSGADIVWLTGYRINDRYKVTSETETVYRMFLGDAKG